MSRIIQVLMALVLLAGLGQWLVPRWAGNLLAREVSRVDHGPRPSVAVSAMPFWELADGRFHDVSINASQVTVQNFVVQHVHLTWTNGAIALGPLEKGHLKVDKPGHLSMTAVLTGPALSRFIARQGSISNPQVAIKPSGVSLKGRIKLGGSSVPLDTRGTLVESQNHQALVFHPTSIDGLQLPVLTDVQLLNLSSLNLPMPLKIQHVRLENNRLALTIGN